MTAPNLTRDIGQAERTLRALLERLLEEAGLSFAEWTVLVFLDGAGGPLIAGELVRRQVVGRVVSEAEARAAVDGLLSRGLLAPADEVHGTGGPGDGEDPRLAPTAAAEAAYLPVRRAVDHIADGLYGDLPVTDLEATHRTLAEVYRRANAWLAASGG
jgi:hypothetical protein